MTSAFKNHFQSPKFILITRNSLELGYFHHHRHHHHHHVRLLKVSYATKHRNNLTITTVQFKLGPEY